MTHIKTWRERTNARGIGSCEAMDEEINELRAALAQQGEPVAYMAKNKNGGTESLIRARLLEQIGRSDDHDYTPLYAGVAQAPVEQRCTYCDGTGDVHSIDGEWRGTCHCAAAPAPQAQPDWLLKTTQDLANSIRRRCFPEVPQFQVLDDLAGVISQIDNMTCGMERKSAPQAQDKSDNYLSGYCTGRTDLLKEQSAQPVAQPLTLEQILDIVKKLDETPDMSHVDVLKTFARAIEKAHGINYEK